MDNKPILNIIPLNGKKMKIKKGFATEYYYDLSHTYVFRQAYKMKDFRRHKSAKEVRAFNKSQDRNKFKGTAKQELTTVDATQRKSLVKLLLEQKALKEGGICYHDDLSISRVKRQVYIPRTYETSKPLPTDLKHVNSDRTCLINKIIEQKRRTARKAKAAQREFLTERQLTQAELRYL